jgi:hypothetical protein
VKAEGETEPPHRKALNVQYRKAGKVSFPTTSVTVLA